MYFNLSNFNWFIARRPMSNTDDIKEIYYYHFSIKHTIKTAILLFFAYTLNLLITKKQRNANLQMSCVLLSIHMIQD